MKIIVYTDKDTGLLCVVFPTSEDIPIEDVMAASVPDNVDAIVVEEDVLPTYRTFRDAWAKDNKTVYTDLAKAKLIAHDMRRTKRSIEFAPWDIQATIPAKAAEAEAARQEIRDRYAIIQANIDSAQNVEELKTIVDAM